MRKLLLVATTILCLYSIPSTAQVYKQGNVVIDGYYGFPNLASTWLKAIYQSSIDAGYYPGFKMTSVGPMGIKGEYLLTEKFGIGLNVNGAITKISSNYYDGSNTYNYSASYNRLRVMGTFNFHFGNAAKVDPYLSLQGGYLTSKLQEKTNDPNYGSVTLKNLVPVCIRVEFGTRVYFTDHIGAVAQIGIGGGPILAAGLTTKF